MPKMNLQRITAATIAALLIASATFAESSRPKASHEKAAIVATMIANHDINLDGGLDSVELAASIEALYEMRQNAFRNHRDAMVERGVVTPSEASNGIVTLSLLPDDGAALLMKQADTNHDQILRADELMESTRIWPTLSLGARPYRGTQS